MRLAVVILALAAIAVALVHIRRAKTSLQHEIQDLRTQQVALRRQVGDGHARAWNLMALGQIRHRALEEMGLDLVDKTQLSAGGAEAGRTKGAPQR
jgi:cell division protein FtsL